MPEYHQEPPDVSLYGLLFTIPRSFGGMTTVALHRATSISRTYDRRVDILTLAPDLDVTSKAAELRNSGMLGGDVRLRNLWKELRESPDEELDHFVGTVRNPIRGDEELPAVPHDGGTERHGDDGSVLQVNRLRDDGTLLVTDRKDVHARGRMGGRRLTLFDRRGRVLTQWHSATSLYQSWLDVVTAGQTAVVISDSNFVGSLMHNYRRDNVTFVHALHSPHLADPTGSVDGRINQAKKSVLTNLDYYDLVTTPTAAQRADMLATNIAVDNIATVSNSYAGGTVTDIEERTPTRGVVVARLSGVKRLDHAVRAIANTDVAGVTLDIYGSGGSQPRLQKTVDDLDVAERVRLHGYDPQARKQFTAASFTLMTSKFEGQGVTLLESMASGCIPIAYDIRYGPSSIITHGVDGFLVPPGDVDALTATITHVVTLDAATLQGMRHAAVRRVMEYRPEVIAGQWAELLSNAVRSKRPVATLTGRATLRNVEVLDGVRRLTVAVTSPSPQELDWGCLTWIGRETNIYGRVRAAITADNGGCLLEADIPLQRLSDIGSEELELFADIRSAGTAQRLQISASAATLPRASTDTVELFVPAKGRLGLRRRSRNEQTTTPSRRPGIELQFRRGVRLIKRLYRRVKSR